MTNQQRNITMGSQNSVRKIITVQANSTLKTFSSLDPSILINYLFWFSIVYSEVRLFGGKLDTLSKHICGRGPNSLQALQEGK